MHSSPFAYTHCSCGYSKYAKLDIHIVGRRTHLIYTDGIAISDPIDEDTVRNSVSATNEEMLLQLEKECQQVLKDSDAQRARLHRHRLDVCCMYAFEL